MLCVYAVFTAAAFLLDTPAEIWTGLIRILTSRSLLITDYIDLGGIGATLINAVIVGCFSMAVLIIGGTKPNGSTIMGLWLSVGFGLFGKNVFNMLPLTFGVWLYARVKKQPFISVSLAALLCATVSPIVSELSFLGLYGQPWDLMIGAAVGMFIGFIFTPLSAYLVKIHAGYNLYNMGFAGGLISTFMVCLLRSSGIEVGTMSYWSGGNNLPLAILLYVLALAFIVMGFLFDGGPRGKLKKLRKIHGHTGRLVTDYYIMYGEAAYINMGLLCALGTTLVLAIGGDLNGPTLGGIFTMMGFGAFGKHLKNVIPVLIGAVICTIWNAGDPTDPLNMLAILFSTCLAPIAGQFGIVWGIVAGFLHVNVANFIGELNSGLNLYNNGFAGGFVTMLLVPLITTFKKRKIDGDIV